MIYTIVPLFVAEIIRVYLFRGILFLLFSISMKIFEQKLFFSSVNEEMYSEVYHLLDILFKAIIFIIIW